MAAPTPSTDNDRIRILHDIRYDVFTETFSYNSISNEQHTIKDMGHGFYGIRLKEAPKQEDTFYISIPGFTEIESGEPTATQFIMDYEKNSGYAKFHSSKNGTTVNVTYKGKGSVVEAAIINQHRQLNELDHPDGCVTTAKLANDAVTLDKVNDTDQENLRKDNAKGLCVEVRSDDPSNPENGRIWINEG